jgi:hypothetical protein
MIENPRKAEPSALEDKVLMSAAKAIMESDKSVDCRLSEYGKLASQHGYRGDLSNLTTKIGDAAVTQELNDRYNRILEHEAISGSSFR